MLRFLIILGLIIVAPAVLMAQVSDNGLPVKAITDASIVGNVTFYNDTVYNLQGFVFVEDGEVLTIEPGTILKSNTGQGLDATALIVARGGQIIADGTASQPIIFTSINDDLDDPSDIPYGDAGRGLWGGLIMLGYGPINTADSVGSIEGLPGEPRTTYGGAVQNPHDNSGTLRYVSIRHGGSVFGEADEINGLTLGAVGDGTTIEHVEVFQNIDDGIEFFGGTVRCKWMIMAFNGDDCFDIDEGYSGSGQFWFAIQDGIDGDMGGEHDGGTNPENGTPFATPLISNATYIGGGLVPTVAGKNPGCFNIRDNCAPAYYNSIFTEHAGWGVIIEQSGSQPTDSEDRLLAGDLVFQNNVWGKFAAGDTPAALTNGQSWTQTLFTTASFHNMITHPGINVSRQPNGDNDPRPMYYSSLPNWTDPTAYNPPSKPGQGANFTGWFDEVNYVGAFDPTQDLSLSWAAGWSAFDFYGYLGDGGGACACGGTTDNNGAKPEKLFTDADMVGTVTFHCDTVYHLDGFVFVEDGEVLNIEPGTIIKSTTGQGLDATALIVARGGHLYANGTQNCPIIFTTENDIVDDPNDIPYGDAGRGLWGGLIMLGYAPINTADSVGNIEGLPGEPRTTYGGTSQIFTDKSGDLRYVSIRHGGSVFGEADEINGLTLGAAGSNTIVDYVEVFQNIDDGVEFFGGTVNCSHMVMAFNGDDCFDIDEGFSGAGQFWFAIQDGIDGDMGGEHDGGTNPENGTPFATPLISNVTYLGAGLVPTVAGKNPGCFNIRDNCAPAYYNSIFDQHAGWGVIIEQSGSQPTDSEDRLLAGDLVFQNNVWGNFAAGNTPTALANGQAWTETLFTNASFNNVITDPGICVTRTATGDNDLRPKNTGSFPVWTSPLAYNPPVKPGQGAQFDYFFETVNYLGAVDPSGDPSNSWLTGWTAFDTYGYAGLNDDCASTGCCGLYTGGFTGNTDCGVDGKRNLADITKLIDRVYISKAPLCCEENGNVDGDVDGKKNLADITKLIDHVYISKAQTAPCQ